MIISPWDSFKQVSEKVKACSPKAQICDNDFLLCSLLSESWSECHHLIVTAAKGVPYLHNNNQFFLVWKYEVQNKRPSPAVSLISCLKTLTSMHFRKLQDCLWSVVLFLQLGIRVVPWGPGNVNTGLPPVFWRQPYPIFMVSRSVADNCHNVVHLTVLTDLGP